MARQANDQIVSMCSIAGEEVALLKPVAVTEQVEAWLQQLTVAMKATLKEMISKAITSGETDIGRMPSQVLGTAGAGFAVSLQSHMVQAVTS